MSGTHGNPWLAIDAAEAPTLHAHELRDAWERFLGEHEQPEDLVREPIAASWRRSLAAGVDWTGHRLAPVIVDEEDVPERYEEHPLSRHAELIRECISAMADAMGYLTVIADPGGVLLSVSGPGAVRRRAADQMNFVEGVLWSERGAGTNAIGTAIAADHAVQVFGPEHFNEPVQRWTCSAAPVHDPDTGALIGIVDLTGDYSTVHPHSLAVATATARAVEVAMRMELQDADARLRERYAERVAAQPSGRVTRALVAPSGRPLTPLPADWIPRGGDARLRVPPGGGGLVLPNGARAIAEPAGPALDAFVVEAVDQPGRRRTPAPPLLELRMLGPGGAWVQLDGRETRLRPRLAEILALLCANPHGYTAEKLCADLHGDGGSPGSVRVEVSRLRKLLGHWIDTERYRLTCGVQTDARRVEGLLSQGKVRDAAEHYPGPLLPDSVAPGVVREREKLEHWLRHAVMTSDDAEALWAWVQTPGGDDDLAAWKRLLQLLPYRDVRRPRCAARAGELRSESATTM